MSKPLSRTNVTPSSFNPFPKVFHAKMGQSQVWSMSDEHGMSDLGVNIEELKPGAASGLAHWHTLSEEFVYVLSGELTLHYGTEKFTLTAGETIGFMANEGKGHRLVNETALPASFLVEGTRLEGDEVVYTDDDLLWREDDKGVWRAARKTGEFYDES